MKDNKKDENIRKCLEKEDELLMCQARLKDIIGSKLSTDYEDEVRLLFKQIEILTDEICLLKLHHQFYEYLGIWADELNLSYGDVFADIVVDMKKLKDDYKYENELIGIAVKSFMELEMLIRDFFIKRCLQEKSNGRTSISQVLREIEGLGEFSDGQITILRKIIRLRNWLTHDLIKEEMAYVKDHTSSFGIVNVSVWKNYYYSKLVILKNMLFEAIDLFDNYDGSTLRFL